MNTILLLGLVVFPAATPQDPPKPVAAPAAAAAPQDHAPAYKVLATFAIGGEGSWDYVTVDSDARRLYVPRSTHVLVLDADTGKQVGEIADTQGVHGVALAPEFGRGFTSNGRANTVTVFDTKTLAVQKTIAVGKNPDALAYDPASKCVYIGDGRSGEVSVISADKLELVATIAVGGKPEAVVADGAGHVFVNVEDKSEVVRIDSSKNVVQAHYALAPGEEPTGLAIDRQHHLLFAACGNEKLVVLDAETGKVLATPAIGKRVDAAMFDAELGLVFASNGDGTLSVVATRGEPPFAVVQTLKTLAGARTMVLDPKTHKLYLPTAEYENTPADASGGRRRPAIKAGSFRILVVGK